MACVVLLAHVVARKSSFYDALTRPKHATFEPEAEVNAKLKNRHEMLDGLRGFLALGVLFQHAVTNFAYFSTGIWKITDVRFYRHAGGEAVILFFMITSFLYWSKAIASKGNMDTKRLYRNRFMRLAPMYIFSAGLVTLSVLVQTGFNIASITGFIKDILSWLTLGLVTTTTVNGLSIIPINAGIHWTLHYEWIFYLLLPFSAIALRGGIYRLFTIPVVALVLLMSDWGYWIIFLFGIAAAHIVHKWPRANWIRENWVISFVPIAGLIAIYLIQYKPYGVSQYVISLGILLCFIYGNNLFGLLKTKAALFLGTISYSVYLMHGIVLFTVLHLANTITPVAELTAWCFWGLILISALLTVLVSTITYKYIEHPFLKKR
jgi:peptidoglycan/LPS O-acetylase OafA/YrhL